MNWPFWAACFAGTVTAANLVSLGLAMMRMRRRRGHLPPASDAPPVSIVRPVCGLEPFSAETLRSGFELDYPRYENVFCVADAGDPIVPIVERLMAQHPAIPSRLLVGEDIVSANPKLNNCVKGWNAARHEWIILADSNLLMPRDYVQRLFGNWRQDTGLVCSTPAGSRPDGFWAEVECAFLNTLQARWQYVGEALGLGFAQGKTLLWRRAFLEAKGGIAALSQDIAEDAAATKIVRDAGLHVHLVDAPFEQPLGRRNGAEVWNRQLRWARLRRVTFPLFFAPEIVSGPLVPLAAGLAAAWSYGWNPAPIVLAVLGSWYGGEALLASSQGWFLSWRTPAAFLVRDVLVVRMWIYAWFAEDIVWRGNAMTIRTKGSQPLATGDGMTL